jgi:hypothetical protein
MRISRITLSYVVRVSLKRRDNCNRRHPSRTNRGGRVAGILLATQSAFPVLRTVFAAEWSSGERPYFQNFVTALTIGTSNMCMRLLKLRNARELC